jgi:hypothetical protein
MELWQMDVMGGVLLDDGTECKAITGIDDHSGSASSPEPIRDTGTETSQNALVTRGIRLSVPPARRPPSRHGPATVPLGRARSSSVPGVRRGCDPQDRMRRVIELAVDIDRAITELRGVRRTGDRHLLADDSLPITTKTPRHC